MKNKTDWLHEKSSQVASMLFALPLGIAYLVESSHEYHDLLDDRLDSRVACYIWWRLLGQKQYTEIDWPMDAQELAYLAENPVDQVLKKYPLVLMLYLQSTSQFCHLSEEYLAEMKSLTFVSDDSDILELPNFVLKIYGQRPDLQKMFNLQQVHGYLGLLRWWTGFGEYEYPRIQWSINGSASNELLKAVTFGTVNKVPLFIEAIYTERVDLQTHFGSKESCDLSGLADWWNKHGVEEYEYLNDISLQLNQQADCLTPVVEIKPGVNVIGFPQGVLGIGEDARLIADSCVTSKIPCALINAPIVGPEQQLSINEGTELVHFPKHDLSIFCLPAAEMMRLALEKGRYLINSDAYAIGAWPWELPNWPIAYDRVRGFVDEIWAQSTFVQDCFAKHGDTPVHKMPMAVTLPKPTEDVRQKYELPKDAFLFYVMFDGNSWLTRKNPMAGILAFQKAFPKNKREHNVGLVIKAMNVEGRDEWQQALKIANADPRIKIIADKLDRQTLVNLMDSCDSYISLHRSEGFGRVIAEAMLLGQPVVATNFSGNVDYCHEDTAFLVDGDLVPVKPGDYIFHSGQYWCDPDIDQAVAQMRTIYENKSLRVKIASNAKSYIEANYSAETVSKLHLSRLTHIWENYGR